MERKATKMKKSGQKRNVKKLSNNLKIKISHQYLKRNRNLTHPVGQRTSNELVKIV